jgi:exonuclease SbcC
MKNISKITISNIRRFSENVEIKIGEGATVFLAPNGTGKTAIFEAIELALTGKVKRLEYPPEVLIRDTFSDASIRLDFDSNKYCEATFKKGQNPRINGNHQELFGTISKEEIPFLLRLTHLLDQHGEDWFVQSHGAKAGEQLDHLSIGREAVMANSKITSTKKAANALFETAKREENDAISNFDKWTKLLEKRNNANSEFSRSLIPRVQLLEKINLIASKIEGINPDLNEQIPSIKSHWSEVSAATDRLTASYRNQFISLATIDLMVDEFIDAGVVLTKTNEVIKITHDRKKKIEEDLITLQGNLEIKLEILNTHELTLKNYFELKRQIDILNKNQADQIALEDSLLQSKDRVKTNDHNFQLAKSKVEHALKTKELHDLLFIRAEAISIEKAQLMSTGDLILRWKNINQMLSDLLQTTRPNLINVVKTSTEKLLVLNNENEIYTNSLNAAQHSFDSLNAASDSILEAVGIIALNYPQERGDCPVCLQNYEPLELRERIAKALNTINPELKTAVQRLEDAKEKFKAVNDNLTIAQDNSIKATQVLKEIDEQIAAMQLEIAQVIIPKFPDCNTIAQAEIYLKNRSSKNETSKIQLDKEKTEALPDISKEQLAILENDLEKSKILISTLQEEIRVAEVRQNDLKEIKKSVEANLINFKNLKDINDKIVIEETLIAKTQNEIQTIRKSIENQMNSVIEIKESLTRDEKYISQINSQLSEYRAKWLDLKLQGDPTEESLKSAKSDLNSKILFWEEKRNELDSLHGEIARWEASEEFIRSEEEIKAIRQEIAESNYTAELKNKVESVNKKVKYLSEKINTLNIFSIHLSTELETVHERIRSINPIWNKLLKRVVVDPRFSETNLNSFSHYKKQNANVNVQLHGQNVLVSHVASEAQITDLQLTFLMAMAQKYQWSPWRALLLDDPTQHHDLVHAAAVFDLLRDYIVEFKFQVMLATHDSVQAHFFMRKLENDGIPATLWTLSATDNGVKAILN